MAVNRPKPFDKDNRDKDEIIRFLEARIETLTNTIKQKNACISELKSQLDHYEGVYR